MAYPAAHNQSPFLSNKKFSKLKAEKVLNPPQNPTINRVRIHSFSGCAMYRYMRNPRMHEAKIFTRRVGTIKYFGLEKGMAPRIYRKQQPVPPPIKTKRKWYTLKAFIL